MTDLVNNTNTVDERTRAFFERNLQVRNKLQNETHVVVGFPYLVKLINCKYLLLNDEYNGGLYKLKKND